MKSFVVFLGLTILMMANRVQAETPADTLTLGTVDLDISQSPKLGEDSAPVKLVLFTAFDCPGCRTFKPTLMKVVEHYGKDKVQLIIKNGAISRNSHIFQAIAFCAGVQGKYWEVYDDFFTNLDKFFAKGTKIETLVRALEKHGVKMDPLMACLDGSDTKQPEEERKPVWAEPIIDRDYKEGWSLGIRFLPTLFVNKQMLSGGMDEEKLRLAIDKALEAK